MRKVTGLFWRILLVLFVIASGEDALYASGSPAVIDTVLQLRTVEVTAVRKPLATVQTLSGVKLQALSSTSIADALKYFAGVQIKDYGGLGGLKTINVRSLGSQHVGVYIDGIRITNAQNGTVDLGKFSLSTLESVSLYNANRLDACQSASEYASGATVYLQTRCPETDSLTVLGGVGSFHSYRGRVNAQFNRNGWSGFIDGNIFIAKVTILSDISRNMRIPSGGAKIPTSGIIVSKVLSLKADLHPTYIIISRSAVVREA